MNNPQKREYIGDSKISSAERDWILRQPAEQIVSETDLLKLAQQAAAGRDGVNG